MVKSPLSKLVALLAFIALLSLCAYFFTSPDVTKTKKEANRFHAVAMQGTNLIDALREAPDFHAVYFGDCAHIDRAATTGEANPFVFVPKVGASVKYRTVEEALAQNSAMLRDYESCRNATAVYMDTFPYRGVVSIELDAKGNIRKAQEPVFSN
jgi:hypothetical protein